MPDPATAAAPVQPPDLSRDESETLTVRLPGDVARALRALAERMGESRGVAARKALRTGLATLAAVDAQ